MSDFQEKDLYEPVKNMLEENGYEVKGEIKNCDIAAVKNGELIVVELKKAFNLKLVYQLLERQSFSKYVYAAIARPNESRRSSSYRSMLKLLKKIDCGLITIAMDSPIKTVDILLEPCGTKKISNYEKKKTIEGEFKSRSGSLNTGGVTKKEIITAYREKSIEILCFAEKNEIVTNTLLKENGYSQKEYSILYRNYYGWFKKTGRGTYELSEDGKRALEKEEYMPLVKYYREKAENK